MRRWAVDDATPRYLLASVSRMLGRVSKSSNNRSALSTDSMGYCGGGPYLESSSARDADMSFMLLTGGFSLCPARAQAVNEAHQVVRVHVSKQSLC